MYGRWENWDRCAWRGAARDEEWKFTDRRCACVRVCVHVCFVAFACSGPSVIYWFPLIYRFHIQCGNKIQWRLHYTTTESTANTNASFLLRKRNDSLYHSPQSHVQFAQSVGWVRDAFIGNDIAPVDWKIWINQMELMGSKVMPKGCIGINLRI